MDCLLLVTLLALVLVGSGAACKPARFHTVHEDGKAIRKWDCPPNEVLFQYNDNYRCFEKHEKCPNGFYYKNKCHCFPATSRDSAGICGKICRDCENGWCSSVSKCVCNEGFILSQGRCIFGGQLYPPYYPSHYPNYGGYQHHSPSQYPTGLYPGSQLPPQMYPNYPPQQRPGIEYDPQAASQPLIPGFNPELASTYPPHQTPKYPSEHPSGIRPQQTPERPRQGYPETPSQPSPQYPSQDPTGFRPQQTPERPLQRYPETPSQQSPKFPSQDRPNLQFDAPPQSPSGLRPQIPLNFNPGPNVEHSSPICQTDYVWDSKIGACIPYEFAKTLKIDPRLQN